MLQDLFFNWILGFQKRTILRFPHLGGDPTTELTLVSGGFNSSNTVLDGLFNNGSGYDFRDFTDIVEVGEEAAVRVLEDRSETGEGFDGGADHCFGDCGCAREDGAKADTWEGKAVVVFGDDATVDWREGGAGCDESGAGCPFEKVGGDGFVETSRV